VKIAQQINNGFKKEGIMQLELFEPTPYEVISKVFMGEWKYLIKAGKKEFWTNVTDEKIILQYIGKN